ncbi:MAG: hypothetical protein E7463_12825 [Ruminococcaceae bacterium]|nr:hypothetical protein [Oscillospiraceae bacterium]
MLKAGFARLDVTPPLGSYVAGVFYPRFAKEVLDPIQLNALAVSVGEETVLIIAADFLMMKREYASEIRALIEEKTGVPAKNIMLPCLHQHSSIALRKHAQSILEDTAYISVLYRKFADIAALAILDMAEAELACGTERTSEDLAFIRRYIMKDGRIETNPGGALKAEIASRYAEADNNVRLCRFKRQEKNDIALVNFSTHADVIHKELFSADWPGFVRRYVEADLAGVSCVMTVGVQGDSNHVDFLAEKSKDGYGHSDHMGRVIADAVIKMWDDLTPHAVEKIAARQDVVYNRTRTDGEERYEESLAYRDAVREKRLPMDITRSGEAARIVGIREAPIYQKIPVSAIRMGDVGFVGFGGEPFTAYAEAVRAANPGMFILTFCCTNGGEGYLPTEKAFSEGGYEARSSAFSPNIEKQCTEMASKLLRG